MTFRDPVPPGHGEPARQPEGDRTYEVVVVLGDAVENVESRWGNLDAAITERDRVRAELKQQNYHDCFAGVLDQDDPERGWLEGDD